MSSKRKRNTELTPAVEPLVKAPSEAELALLKKEKKDVIKTIKKLKLRTTPAELAANSSLSINQSSFWLNKIASETGSGLEVAEDGTIFYSFKPNFTDAYLQHGIKKKALSIFSAFVKMLYWIMRFSFGVILVTSVLVIVVLIIAVVVTIAAGSDSDSGIELPDFDMPDVDIPDTGIANGFYQLDFLFDAFRWNYSPSHSSYPNSLPSNRRENYRHFVEKHPKGNFFLECFSFLFGDGNPNSNLEEIRWTQIARVIKQHGGVVSAEQLAPFLDGNRSDSGMILSALAQFNGRPVVTESGFIVYVFEDFLEAGPTISTTHPEQLSYLKEDNWNFSSFPVGSQVKVFLVALFNFLGSWWLFAHIANYAILQHVFLLIDFLFSYAIFFLLIPLVRFVIISVLNHRIHGRNKLREKALALVKDPQGEVLRELEEAKVVREQEVKLLSSSKEIIYSSERDDLEQRMEEELEQEDS